jgi:hypothetical protein
VFLLSLRAGSAGLTLTAATRVYLLEPALDPAVEQQAVARVHRIGQEKEVVITRLLVTDTVEEEVGIFLYSMEVSQPSFLTYVSEQLRLQTRPHVYSTKQHAKGRSPRDIKTATVLTSSLVASS